VLHSAPATAQPYINLKLEFIDTADGDIRIGTKPDGLGGGWSRVGTDAKNEKPSWNTMAISFINDPKEDGRIIQHEFGHALGIKHEHRHPDNPLMYNRQKIEMEYGKFGTNEFFTKIPAGDSTKLTPYDSRSIMHYHLPENYMSNGITNTENYTLSTGDKYLAENLYPPKNKSDRRVFLTKNLKGSFGTYEWALAEKHAGAPQE